MSRMIPYEPCQRKHHSWYEGTDPDWKPAFGLAGEVEICDNCGAVRRRGVNDQGKVITTQYIYPQGYSMTKDQRAVYTKAKLRADWWERERRLGRVEKPKKSRHLKSA